MSPDDAAQPPVSGDAAGADGPTESLETAAGRLRAMSQRERERQLREGPIPDPLAWRVSRRAFAIVSASVLPLYVLTIVVTCVPGIGGHRFVCSQRALDRRTEAPRYENESRFEQRFANSGRRTAGTSFPLPKELAGAGTTRSLECSGTGPRVCLVTLARYPEALPPFLAVAHGVSEEYGVPVYWLPGVTYGGVERSPGEFANQERFQLKAGALLDLFERAVTSRDGQATFIALVPYDVYDPSSDAPYVLSSRSRGPRPEGAVIATPRLINANYGEPVDVALADARVRKLVLREIGARHFGLPPSSDPTSLMFEDVRTRFDVDRMADRLDLSPLEPRPVQ